MASRLPVAIAEAGQEVAGGCAEGREEGREEGSPVVEGWISAARGRHGLRGVQCDRRGCDGGVEAWVFAVHVGLEALATHFGGGQPCDAHSHFSTRRKEPMR